MARRDGVTKSARCGDAGGRRADGQPCRQPVRPGQRCHQHPSDGSEPRSGGRPAFEFTDEQIEQVEKLAAVLSQEQMADFFGIHESTLRQRFKDDPRVFRAYTRGRAKAVAGIAGGLIQAARAGDMTAAQFYLKTQAGWSTKDHVEVTGKDGAAIPTTLTIIHRVIDPREADD